MCVSVFVGHSKLQARLHLAAIKLHASRSALHSPAAGSCFKAAQRRTGWQHFHQCALLCHVTQNGLNSSCNNDSINTYLQERVANRLAGTSTKDVDVRRSEAIVMTAAKKTVLKFCNSSDLTVFAANQRHHVAATGLLGFLLPLRQRDCHRWGACWQPRPSPLCVPGWQNGRC